MIPSVLVAPKFINICKANNVKTILDIGAGNQRHSKEFRNNGFLVSTNDIVPTADFKGLYTELPPFDKQFDAIWSCHVLEHQRNVGLFLDRIFTDLKVGGILGISVPPLKHEIVGGHLSLWNAGLVLYNLILAGFDCKNASIASYGYNISVIVEKTPFAMPNLKYDNGDIKTLAPFFPPTLKVRQGFNGQIEMCNWK